MFCSVGKLALLVNHLLLAILEPTAAQDLDVVRYFAPHSARIASSCHSITHAMFAPSRTSMHSFKLC